MAGRAKDGVLRSRRSREGGPLLKDENEQMAGRAKDGALRSRRSREGGPLLKDENEQYEFEKQMKRQESHVLRLHS